MNLNEFNYYKSVLEKVCGISVARDKEYLLENNLKNLCCYYNCNSLSEFFFKIPEIYSDNPKIRDLIIDALIPKETFWFRDNVPFEFLEKVVLPDLIKENTPPRIRIWSAGCSTGQEVYSVVMTILEMMERDKKSIYTKTLFDILATDNSSYVLAEAKQGTYDSLSMERGISSAMVQKYFQREGNKYNINSHLKEWVDFQQHNLMDSTAYFGTFDLIFLRNVTIYFADNFRQELLLKLSKNLNPGGYLILGASELIQDKIYIENRYKNLIFYNLAKRNF